MTRKALIIMACAMLLCSCEPQAVRDGRNLWKKYYKKVLKDPESFKVYSEKYIQKDNIEVEWTLDVGAKNGAGGMVRETEHLTTIGGYFLHIDGETIRCEDLE